MRIHFRDHHPEDTIVVEQEGEYPRCDSCGMFVADTGKKHKSTKMCKDATTRREKQKVARTHATMERMVVFTINGEPIETVEEFKYLGRIVTREDDDEVAVKGNLAKAKKKWASM
jgi:translation elongation factor EF-1alpha